MIRSFGRAGMKKNVYAATVRAKKVTGYTYITIRLMIDEWPRNLVGDAILMRIIEWKGRARQGAGRQEGRRCSMWLSHARTYVVLLPGRTLPCASAMFGIDRMFVDGCA